MVSRASAVRIRQSGLQQSRKSPACSFEVTYTAPSVGATARVSLSAASPYPFVGQGWTTAMPYGLLPVAMVAVALNVLGSRTDSVLAPWFAT
jgi:hypothetical protein